MSEAGQAERAAAALQAVVKQAAQGLIDREVLVELIVLGAIAHEHVLVIGEPGTAKSAAVRRVATALGGSYFEYLLGRFTEPSEIFGPIDLLELQRGKLETRTTGMLPEAQIAFLDEVFQGSSAILNTLLGVLNERKFRRGHALRDVPLRLCVGASNALPDNPSLAAFADRFLIRVFVSPVADSELEALLTAGFAEHGPNEALASMQDVDVLARAVDRTDLSAVQSRLAESIRTLRRAGIALSDRRIVRAQRLVAAASVLAGRARASFADLWPLVYAVPTEVEQVTAREVLQALLKEAESPLAAAALDASAGLLARAQRIERVATELLAEHPPEAEQSAWRLKLEAICREIDATFAPDALPAALQPIRQRIAALFA